MRRGVRLIGAVLVTVGVLALPGAAAPAAPRVAKRALSTLDERYLTTRPPVGAMWVVDISSSSDAERLMMRTLQGIVNRTSARMYVKDPGDQGAQRWIDEYTSRGLVTLAGTTDVAGALDRFAAEATGYVLATEAEPWTFNVAATIATVQGGIVATPELVPELAARGLTPLDDVRGKWSDAATAYEAMVATYRSQMAYPGIAVIREGDALWDFTTQQGIMTVYTRPSDPDWPRIEALIDASPPGHAVYGYLSTTGDEEAVAVGSLSQAGLILVPTDTVRNLSFQVAVGADLPRTKLAPATSAAVQPCTKDQVNVVVGVTDGDNLVVPLSHLSSDANWNSPNRGQIPLGWSIGPSLAVLAPSAWDAYASEATADDELVGMLGLGYAAPGLLPDPVQYYRDSFALMASLGMRTFWSLGGGLEQPAGSGWENLDEAAGTGIPHTVLAGYGNGTGTGAAFYSPAGRPAFTSGTLYGDSPGQLVSLVQGLIAKPAADRPFVTFLSATNWSNPVGDLVAALAPLQAQGVRFLTPSEAGACVPPPPDDTPPVPQPSECLPHDPFVRSGLGIIRDAVQGEIKRTPTVLDLPLAMTATPAVEAGGTIDYKLTATVDLQALAGTILEDRARPVIEEGYGASLAATASVQLAFDHITLRLPLADGTVAVGQPTITSTGDPAHAAWVTGAAPGIQVTLDPQTVDTKTTTAPFTLTLAWQARAASRAAEWTAPVSPGATTYNLSVGIGVQLGTLALFGAVWAPWTCAPSGTVLATTKVAARAATATTTTAPSPTTTTTAPTTDPGLPGGPTATTAPTTSTSTTTGTSVPPTGSTTSVLIEPPPSTTAPPTSGSPGSGGGVSGTSDQTPSAVPVAGVASFTG